MGVGLAIGAAALIGAGATAYASKSASDSAADANSANQKNVADTNALNYRMFLESRGSGGNALLPLYFPEGTESQLASRALQLYQAEQGSMGTPQEQVDRYNSVVQGLTPSMAAGDKLVQDLFSGALADEEVQNIQPVLAARGAVAGAQKQGILEGLMQRLSALSADRARAGYTGGRSAFQQALLNGATIPALQAAGTVGAQADLANATDVANIRNGAITTKMQNLSMPLTQAANRAQLINLPATATAAANNSSLSAFDWFKLNTQAYQNQASPLVTPVPNTGQIVGSAVSAGASTLGNYYANKALASQLSGSNSSSYGVNDYLQQQRMLQESGQLNGSNLFSTYSEGPI